MTQIHKIDKGPIGANCYIIEGEDRSVLIDPCVPFSEIPKLRSAIDLLIVTHCHYDHIAHIEELKKVTHAIVSAHESDFPAFSDPEKNASIYFSYECHYSNPDVKIDLSNEINLGAGWKIKGLHTPGHTLGSICLLLYEKNDLRLCFTGDTIFKGSAGRTDIGGNYTDLICSIRELMKLPDSVIIMPGHGDSSTIGVERLENPFTKL